MDGTLIGPFSRGVFLCPPKRARCLSSTRSFWRIVDEGLAASRLELVGPERAAVDGHARLLVAWNAAINLTSLRSPEQIARNHILDSLLALPALRALASDVGSLLDIGSGGGFPGLPLVATLRPLRARRWSNRSARRHASWPWPRRRSVRRSPRTPDVLLPSSPWSRSVPRMSPTSPISASHGNWSRRGPLGHWPKSPSWACRLPATAATSWPGSCDDGDGSLAREVEAARRISQACGGAAPRIVPIDARRAGRPGRPLPGHHQEGPADA